MDPNWPLSTFASVTIDLKDDAELASSDNSSGVIGPGEVYVRVGTPAQMDEARVQKKMALTETTIRALGYESDVEEGERRPFDGILSETRIEVVTTTRDEIWEDKT